MKKSTLQSLIRRNFLSNALIPILVIEFLLITLYFSINSYVAVQNQKVLSNEVLTSLQKIISREANEINQNLQSVSRTALLMQNSHTRFFKDHDQCHLPKEPPLFGKHANGAYFKLKDNGGSSLYYSGSTTIGNEQILKALCSEGLDPMLKDIVDINPLIDQAYLNTHDDMSRIYPFLENVPTQFGGAIDVEKFNFYFLADALHNPDKGRKWTEAYLDPAGLGWMVSVVVPIYVDDFLEGVSGLDVTIDTIISHVLNLDLPWQSSAFMVDREGVILAMPEKIEQLFSLSELTSHDYQKVVDSTINKPMDFNIFNTPDLTLRSQFKEMFQIDNSLHQVQINHHRYTLSNSLIAETGWRLFVISDQESVLLPIKQIKELNQQIGYYALLAMLVFYIIFFLHITNRSRRVAQFISFPIEQLTQQTSVIGKQFNVINKAKRGIAEIDKLTDNFNEMSQELDSRASALIQETIKKELIEQERKIYKELAVHDGLTHLFNRHKIDQILTSELQRTLRYQHDLAIILLDIDFFKDVNDAYGHAVGDEVLIDISRLLLKNLRNSDFVGRWGGEEFMIISPETGAPEALKIAEKMRSSIEQTEFNKVDQITASFGVAILQQGDSIETLFNRADDALYQAKKAGRNGCKLG